MKYKVVGWTNWDNKEVEETYCTYAQRFAIIDHIKEKGFSFTGCHHQESECCVPVLNDGKMRRFSQRAWGRVMAEAHDLFGDFDYSTYAFDWGDDDETKRPDPTEDKFFPATFIPEEIRSESFVIKANDKVFSSAQETHSIKLKDLKAYRYIDIGDTVILKCNDNSVSYKVVGLERKQSSQMDKYLDYYTKVLMGIREPEKIQKRPPTFLFLNLEPES